MADQGYGISALQRIVTAYAPAELRASFLHLWAFDARMANILRSTTEPMIGQMRLTWWHEALEQGVPEKGSGEPLMEALRREVVPQAGADGLRSIIEGWETLLEPLPLTDSRLIAFAEHRGGGLFQAMGRLAGGAPPWLAQAGMAWALWDLAGHVSDRQTARRAIELVPEFLADVPERGWPSALAPLRMLAALARSDARSGRVPPSGLSASQYARILWWGLARR